MYTKYIYVDIYKQIRENINQFSLILRFNYHNLDRSLHNIEIWNISGLCRG